MTDFEQFKIKLYDHWILYLHQHQFPYIGRCYAWARREDAAKVTDLSSIEAKELFEIIIPQWDQGVRKLFRHDWPNVSILGNEAPHLHAHLIPRYHSLRQFYGLEFVDSNPKGNYAPYLKKEIPLETLLQIKNDLGAALEH